MKVGRIEGSGATERLGFVVDLDGHESVLDFARAAESRLGELPFENTMAALIEAGPQGLNVSYNIIEWSLREGEPQWFLPLDDVRWMVPVKPNIFLCAGRNFGRHRDESLLSRAQKGQTGDIHFDFPTGFVQLPHTLVPHKAIVSRPCDVKEFDYEIEVAAIIGRKIERVSAEKALEAVFGYTVFNDLSAREWQRKEMQNQMILIGKNFPGFGPIGPYILTADEVRDPSQFVLDLAVNGEQRQHESCSDMIFDFSQLIEFWSRIGLRPGDIIASGTPGGVATHRKPDPTPFYLKPGDRVAASVSSIGVLETYIS